MKPLLFVLAILAALAGGGAWYWHRNSKPPVSFKTAEVKHGELLATISATGTIEPEEVIDVGAQVGGLIDKFGTDADGKQVDYGSNVKEGMVLAHIDERIYAADLDTAKATLDQAKATDQHNVADLSRLQALLDQAKNDWDRAQKIGPSDALSKNDYDMYHANYETAKANLEVGRATVEQSKAAVAIAQSALDRAKANVNYCTIASPVNGIIIDRRVNIGQTVVSSLSAPSLFLIAKDLRKMQLWIAVNEADVGNIHAGQNVTFTVDAFPGETFQGTVNKVRLNATMTQNVVTYTVEVNTDNSSGRLLPYLTANVQFEVKKDENVQLVPNAALRWYPEVQEVAPDVRAKVLAADENPTPAPEAVNPERGKGKGKKGHARAADMDKTGMVWVQDGQWVRPIDVNVGPTDGTNTEITSADLKDGMQVIVGEVHADEANAQTTNPFAPQMFKRKKGK
ncbi:MAG TPA: efflux RND transporter periplasmic adaptor subunit [Tepidisphaeraceae bacterium]|nr:efflux RND transporter periplasmic adaptor subunit [Tepidisphaeraceae bacterium]